MFSDKESISGDNEIFEKQNYIPIKPLIFPAFPLNPLASNFKTTTDRAVTFLNNSNKETSELVN